MELRQLHTFITIVECTSFTQAAQLLGYAQSTVTSQIQQLEDDLGVKLFERLGKKVFLTSHGENLLPLAKKITGLCLEAKNVVQVPKSPTGTITIGTVESLCIKWLPEVYKEYHKRYPEVDIKMKLGNCADFKNFLRNNIVDLAFFLDSPLDDPEIDIVYSVDEPMIVLTSPDHHLSKKEAVFPTDFENDRLILTEKGCSYRISVENILKEANVTPTAILDIESVQAIKLLVMSGFGTSILPRFAVEEELKLGKLISLNWKGPEFGMKIQLAYHKDKWLTSAMKAFIDLAKEMMY